MTSPGARYSAGTAILDVVPVFKGVQDAIKAKVKEMEKALGQEAGEQFGKSFGDSATKAVDKALGTSQSKASEKQGAEAGKKYGGAFAAEVQKAVASSQKEVRAALRITADDGEAQRTLREIEARLKVLNKAKIGIDLDSNEALTQIRLITIQLDRMAATRDIGIRTNFGAVSAAVAKARKEIERLSGIVVEPEIKFDEKKLGLFERTIRARLKAAMESIPDLAFNADASPAMSRLQALRMEMQALADKRINVDIDGKDALQEMTRLRSALAALQNDKDVDVRVRADAAQAASELLAVKTLTDLIDGKNVKVKATLEDNSFASRVHKIRNALQGSGQDGQDAANGFRAFNAVVLAGAAILPAAVPALGALAGGLALLGPLAIGAAAGLGVLGIAFTGIGDAVKGIQKVQEDGGKEAEALAKRQTAAARSVADAQRAVTRAEQSGAQSISSANRAVSDARENAARVAQDAAERVSDAVEAQKDAERDLANAQKAVQRAQEDLTRARAEATEQLEDLQLAVRGGALAERDAVLDLKEAQEALAEARAEGVEGDDLDRLILKYDQAAFRLDEVRERNGDLAEEQAEWARTGVEGSDRVRAAQQGVADAQEGVRAATERLADATANIARAQADGERARADAARQVADAVANARDAEVSAAQSTEDARRNLTQAQEDYALAMQETTASTDALGDAMAKLGPAGQEFAYFWAGVLPQFREMRDLVQAGMFPGLQEAISDILTVNGPQLREFMGAMGTTLGDMFRQFGDMMTSPQWMGIWATFSQYAPIFMQQFGEVGLAMLTFFGELFQALAPYAERFGDALIRMAEGMAGWAAGLSESESFRGFMEWLFEVGPLVWETMLDIGKAIGNLLLALEPYGRAVLGILDAVAEHIAGMDTDKLGVIVASLIGVVIAFQLAAGAISLLGGLASILAGPLTAVIFAVVAIGIAFAALYIYSEDFRNGINEMFGSLVDALTNLWDAVLGPIFDAFGKSATDMGDIMDVLGTIVGFILEVMVTKWIWMANSIAWFYDNIVWPIIGAFAAAGKWLWEEILQPVFNGIMTGWDLLVTGIKWAWENILNPVWEVLKGAAQILFAFLTVMIFGPLLLAWTLLSEGMKWAYENLIQPMFGWFSDRWDELWNNVLKPGFDALGLAWDLLAAGMRWLYDNIIYPYIIKQFADDFENLKNIFETVVNTIGDIWGWLTDKMQVPINWVIKFVLNEGLFGAYNWIVDKLGLDSIKIDPYDLIGDGRYTFAAGGRVPGYSPTPTADNIPAMLTAGEYVHPVDSVNYYGPDFMEAIRKRRIPREALQYYARGGLVELGRRFQQMGATVSRHSAFDGRTPTSGHGRTSLHYEDRAIDVNTRPGTSAQEQRELAPMADLARSLGFRVIFMSPDHYNHLHVDDGGGKSIIGGLLSGIGGALKAGVGWVADQAGNVWNTITDVLGSLKNSITEPIARFKNEIGESTAGQIITAVPGKMLDLAWDFVKDKVADFFSFGTDSPDNSDIIPTSQRSGPVQNIVRGVAARYGWNEGREWEALYKLIQKESSWNPNAQNPTSTAYGLFQFLNGTWAGTGVRKTSDVEGQATAGLQYISQRYGTPAKAWAFHQKNNWYSEGGQVTADGNSSGAPASSSGPAPTLYDTGGWLPPGITTVLNATNKPEPILTAEQWSELTAGRDGDDAPRGFRDLHLHEQAYDVSEAIDTVNHEVRKMQRTGGRYTGAGTGGN